MAIGERFRSGGAHGIARFLAEHQGCNTGFDVRRDDRGKLSITCGGCGASVEYRAAEAGELAAGGPQGGPVLANGAPAAPAAPQAPPASAAPPPPGPPAAPFGAPGPHGPPPQMAPRRAGTPALPKRRPEAGRPKRKGGLVPGWLPVAAIAALILGGLTMIAIGLTKDDGQEQPAPTPPVGQGGGQKQEGGGQKQQGGGQKQQGGGQKQQGGGQNQAPAPPQQGAAAPSLNRRTFANRFSIGVPAGWEDGIEDGGVAITAPGSTAEIVVFFQQGSSPPGQLAQGARGFLSQRHQGAQIGAPKPVRLGSQRGLRIVATYPGGEEVAVVISAGGFSHLVLRRVDRGASPDLEQQADSALASFKPR